MSFTLLGSSNYQYSNQPDGGEMASQIIALSAISTMCVLFGAKTYNVQYKYLSYSRWLVLLLYICSWAFTVSALILIATNNGNYLSCLLSELACDVFYSGTKILIYCWLIEKVWVVNAPRTSRWQTRSYRIHVFMLTPYIAIFSLMVIFHNAWLESDGLCQIGLQAIATIPLITYDFIFNMYMTILFILPLMKVGSDTNIDWKQSRLHEVAKKTLIASVVCLIASFTNITALAIMNGVERGIVCLTCCLVDVVINVVTIHWVTSQPTSRPTRDTLISGSKGGTHQYETNETPMHALPPSPQRHDNVVSSSTDVQHSTVIPTDKKKRFRFDPTSEQTGGFHNHAWPTSEMNATHYMSATNNQIYKSPAVPEYHPHTQLPPYQSSQIPIPITPGQLPHHSTNGRYVMVTEYEGEFNASSTSPSSSVHETSSHSSKKSLTNIPNHSTSNL
ncbi:hypothetical protein BC941DRAFT_2273 [Chlamydoabsidia padenii]|nr:hypothetical protein BC941DRAFT_2273 [Chlamydoabsidia padenii]